MSCGSGGWRFPSEDVRRHYIQNFTLNGDPRPKNVFSDGRVSEAPFWSLYPSCLLRPSTCERGVFGRTLYKVLGAYHLRKFLKTFPCYPKTICGTVPESSERQRALMATIPVTIGYEVAHVFGGCIHFTAVLLAFLLSNFGAQQEKKAPASDSQGRSSRSLWDSGSDFILVLNLVIVYFFHVLPVLVQRLNRAELYNAIAHNEEKGITVTEG